MEDIGRHAYRGLLPLPTRNALTQMVSGRGGETMQLKTDKPVVMVLGSGWGAHSIIKVVCACSFCMIVCVRACVCSCVCVVWWEGRGWSGCRAQDGARTPSSRWRVEVMVYGVVLCEGG